MAGELLKKINELKKLVFDKSNKEFKRNATEYLNKNALDEDNPAYPAISPMEEEPAAEVPEEDVCQAEECEEPSFIYRMKIQKITAEAISDEEHAIAFYLEKATKCMKHGEFALAEMFKELAGDEMVHSAQLRTALEIYGLDNISKELEGRREAFHILAKAVFEDFQSEDDKKNTEALQKEADKVRKEFDFAKEYAKNKAEYNKEKVTNIINDLIAGKQDIDTAMQNLMKSCKKEAPKKENSK